MILFIKHIDIEGPETIGRFFQDKGYDISIVNLQDGDELPSDLDDIQAVVCLGGPMNVYEEDLYPFLKKENIFIQKVLQNQIPYLGICLGAQLLAKASGSRVTKSPEREVGFFPIKLTEQGISDPIFLNLNRSIDAYQWHEDMVDFQAASNTECQLLARSNGCPVQMIRYKKNVYRFQGHPEFNLPILQHLVDTSIFYHKQRDAKESDPIQNQYIQPADQILNSNTNAMYNWFCKFLDILVSQP